MHLLCVAGQYLGGSIGGLDIRFLVTVAVCVPCHTRQIQARSGGPYHAALYHQLLPSYTCSSNDIVRLTVP